MTAGTLVLVCAVIILVDVGPRAQQLNPLDLLQTPPALIWNTICFGMCVVGGIAIKSTTPGSMSQLVAYSLGISSTTVLGASIGKIMQEDTGDLVYVFIVLYFFIGVINLYWSAMASSSTDLAVFMPVKSSLTLALNCITGLFVWQDWRVIDEWASYAMVYLLVLLGVYTCAQDLDFITSFALRNHIKGAMLSNGIASSSFGKSVKVLVDMWEYDSIDDDDGGGDIDDAEQEERTLLQLKTMGIVLSKGLRGGAIKQDELRQLCMRLFAGLPKKAGLSAPLLQWFHEDWAYFKQYVQHDPEFQEKLLAIARRAGIESAESVPVNVDVNGGDNSLDDSVMTPLI